MEDEDTRNWCGYDPLIARGLPHSSGEGTPSSVPGDPTSVAHLKTIMIS